MGAYIAKQPNGLLCRFSSVVDCITDSNMTEQDYVEYCMQKAKEEALAQLSDPKFIKDFSRVKEDFRDHNMTVSEFKDWLKSVGDTEEFVYEYNAPIDENNELEDINKKLALAADKCYAEGNFTPWGNRCHECFYYSMCNHREQTEYKE